MTPAELRSPKPMGKQMIYAKSNIEDGQRQHTLLRIYVYKIYVIQSTTFVKYVRTYVYIYIIDQISI